ncbi:hypothetical protein RIR_jg2181.t3 [Rhizophagus irregularis DAOM 181602=DAOM 197198]|nr:hypothetical protein RIR_jg2181.t3 [Rhizophagus irregularis DAOM 181602=DAOM 197198]
MISLFNFWVQDAHLEGWTPISKVLWLGRGFKMALRVSLDTEFGLQLRLRYRIPRNPAFRQSYFGMIVHNPLNEPKRQKKY